ncbi:response regulator transcription factor [Lysobacter sp. TAF61]|uniref:response regulator transcription factor n=1 Tax=Lysobacter sp. TAF61 TaxID=3233072 RepID=UPI003F97197D
MPLSEGGLILVVEDHSTIAELIGECLERIGYDVDFARDGVEALRRIDEDAYDLVILDRSLPRLDGIDVCRRISQRQGMRPSVLMLTAHESWADKVTGLEAGADDYLTKPFAPAELQARVTALMKRIRREVAGMVLQVADLTLDCESMRVHRSGVEIHLTPTGLRLLTILMRQSPRVVSREELVRALWRGEEPESDCLRSHLYQVRKAVDAGSSRPLVHTMLTAGYKIADVGVRGHEDTREAFAA